MQQDSTTPTPPRTREEMAGLPALEAGQPWTPGQVAEARAWVAAQDEPQLLAAARYALDLLSVLSTESFALGGDKSARVVLSDAIEAAERA